LIGGKIAAAKMALYYSPVPKQILRLSLQTSLMIFLEIVDPADAKNTLKLKSHGLHHG
jgi:hypothetical protein